MKKTGLLKLVHGIMGVLAAQISIMGCYPFVPAVCAAYSLEKKKTWTFYIGLLLGMCYSMPIQATVKYVFIVILITAGVKFYLWANRSCGGIVAGIICGLVVILMNLAGGCLVRLDQRELMLTFAEAFITIGLTATMHYVIEILRKLPEPDMDRPKVMVNGKEAALVSAVSGLSEAFVTMSRETDAEEPKKIEVLEREITGRMCATCDGCCTCWNENRLTLSESIRDLIRAVTDKMPKAKILEEKYVEQCPKYNGMVEEALQAFGRLELNQAWTKRLKENRYVIAQQLDAMSKLMQEWAENEVCVNDRNRMKIARIAYEAGEKAVCAENIRIYEREHRRLCIKADVSGRWGGGIPTKYYAAAVQKAVGIPMRLSQDSKSIITMEPQEITLYEDVNFYVLSGIATRKKNDSSVSGDSFSKFSLDNGSYNICISDGMGSGPAANRESEMVVDLMEKFLEAGFKKEPAIRMMNSAMVLKGENESYSTLDYAGIDLYSGQLEMIKIGAAAAFIKRGDEVECIMPQSLPAGVDVEQSLEIVKKTLHKGDFLVMVTDGVLEYLHVSKPEERFADLIRAIETENAGVLAKGLLEQVLLFTGGYAMDDMTILAFGIWEK